ncbi:hypothetical protein [Aquabacterium sp. J223]|uniref:hypothetical protein n=1 Tax=Aquabacterium sp. J223 TaxID=2898431 RepID=UPI0021ADACEA|nr:hypothetical protein [Aquabacterium sp. J223]UUX97595.1 hypothetical protein LRS07_10360 [Aquabacterium sp. J223]
MLAALTRLSARHLPPPAPVTSRLEVCPPSLLPEAAPRWSRALRRALVGEAATRPETVGEALQRARDDFAAGLDGLTGQPADFLRSRASRARSLLELWHLRAELFQLVAMQHGEARAHQRLAGLNRHFPTRLPRSAGAAVRA